MMSAKFARYQAKLLILPAATVSLLAGVFLLMNAAAAQDALTWARSYINPFPESDHYNAYVLGDSLASGLAAGLRAAFHDGASVKITEQTVRGSGLARPDRFDWDAKIQSLVKTDSVHIAVIMIGLNDRGSIRTASGYEKFGTEAWRQAYGLRIDALIKRLKDANVAVYWLGLPITSDPNINEDFGVLNQVFRERAYLNGIKYIETWNGFVDQFGQYSAFGPDLTGRTRRLRDTNGVHFTAEGNRKLANFVETVIKRDLEAARRERSIPLAGDEAQQAQIASRAPQAVKKNLTPGSSSGEAASSPAAQPQWRTDIGPRKEVEESGPSTRKRVIARSLADRAVAFSGYAPPGELIAADIGQGLTALATISPATTLSAQALRQQIPLSQRLYYRVLIRGEYVKPREGRADDFRWPHG